ncbi:ATP-binding protein [Nostoc sp. NIES-2111]
MGVLNLALNARDAMPEGGELLIRTRALRLQRDPELADGDYVELSVSDTGTGMPADVIARAFDPFFTTKVVGKGTGLGLSQVYGGMRQAGGSVRIEGCIGEGTTVRLILPRTHVTQTKEETGPNEVDALRVSARILVVDDDDDVRRFIVE